jgi:predicted restriction endonuclease
MNKNIVNLYQEILKGSIITSRVNDRDLINIGKKLMVNIYNPNIDELGKELLSMESSQFYEIDAKFEVYKHDNKWHLSILEILDIKEEGRSNSSYQDYINIIKHIMEIGEFKEEEITNIKFYEMEEGKLYKGIFFLQIYTNYISIHGEGNKPLYNNKYYLNCYEHKVVKFDKEG